MQVVAADGAQSGVECLERDCDAVPAVTGPGTAWNDSSVHWTSSQSIVQLGLCILVRATIHLSRSFLLKDSVCFLPSLGFYATSSCSNALSPLRLWSVLQHAECQQAA